MSKVVRTILTILMDVLIALAIALAMRLVVSFFGTLAAKDWGEMVLAITKPLTIPFGIEAFKTPYGGVFDVDVALTIGVLVVGEWMLGIARDRD